MRSWRGDFVSVGGADNFVETAALFGVFAVVRIVSFSGSVFSGAVRTLELFAAALFRSRRGAIAGGAPVERFAVGFFFDAPFSRTGASMAG